MLTLFRISLYFSLAIHHYLSKKTNLVSSKSLLYALIFGSIMHKGLTFLPSSYPIEYEKPFLSEEILLDTTILLMSTLFIKLGFCIGEICVFQLQYLQTLQSLYPDYIWRKKFCNQHFFSKFKVSVLLILLIIQ